MMIIMIICLKMGIMVLKMNTIPMIDLCVEMN